MLKNLLTLLLTSSLLASPSFGAAGVISCEVPQELAKQGCRCFSQAERAKIAEGITQLKVCEVALAAKEDLIRDRIVVNPATVPEAEHWYQDPRWVVGGIVVSASVGSVLTIWALRK